MLRVMQIRKLYAHNIISIAQKYTLKYLDAEKQYKQQFLFIDKKKDLFITHHKTKR